MAYSYSEWATSKSEGETIAVSFPFLDRDHVYVMVDGSDVSSSLYEWTSDSLITCLAGFPSGTTLRVERRTPTVELPSEQQGTGVFDFAGANLNDLSALYIQQESVDGEEDREGRLSDVEDDLAGVATDVATATTKASEASASATSAADDAAATAADRIAVAADKATVAADKATVAADKATVAADKATTSGYKTDAETAATTATTKASEASTDADDAATAKTDAETAATASESALASFWDMFIGPAASDPTNDLNGDPVTEGQLYWNTVAKEMRVHNGTSFEASYLPASGYVTDAELATELADYLTTAAAASGYEPKDVDILKADTADQLTKGFDHSAYNEGTETTGTFTPDVANGHKQYVTFNGVTAIAEPSTFCDIQLMVTNGASAASLTTSSFDVVDGEAYDTTSGNRFLFYISKVRDAAGNAFSHLTIIAHPSNS